MSKVINKIMFGFCLFSLVLFASAASAITNLLPQIQAVYGGSIHAIDIIEPVGTTNQIRLFVSTEVSANSIFYADLDHSVTNIFATNNFRFRVVPDFNAQANRGTVNGIAGHEESGRLFVADDMTLLSCTMTAGSLVTNLPSSARGVGDVSPPPGGAQFLAVCIRSSVLLALASSNNVNVLYFGALDASGNFTQGTGSPINVGLNIGMSTDIGLTVNPSNQCVYIIDSAGSNGIRKSSNPISALSGSTTFSTIALPAEAASWTGNKRLGFGPEGRMFVASSSGSNKVIAYSDNNGGTWTVVNTGVGGVGGNNIAASYQTNLYSVIFGSAFSTNKGETGSWMSIGTGGGPNQSHANDGAGAFDPLNPLILFCASDQGIASSLTGGFTLFEIDYGLEAVAIQDLDMTADKTLAWTASKSGLRRGAGTPMALTWTPDGIFPTGDGSGYYSIAIDQDDTSGNTVYAGNGNIYKTTDGGTNWTRVWALESNTNGFPNTGHFAALAVHGQNVIAGFYSGSGGITYGTGGLLISQNGGSNWMQAMSSKDVNDILVVNDNSVLVAVAYNATSGAGGIYNQSTSGHVRELTDNVSIRRFATDSIGGIYACGQDANFAIKIYYKLLSDYSWTAITTNGLPTQSQMVSGSGPIMTVGQDSSSSNDLPIIVVGHSLYYLASGSSTWQTSSALTYPDGSVINVLYWDELMVGTSEGLYGQNIVTGGDTNQVASVTGDIDGDQLADLISVVGTNWYVWFSTSQYLVRGGPYVFNISGTPVTGDIDGDGLADLISVVGSSWYVWFSTAQYLVRGGPYNMGISGTPTTGDIDGDGLADLISVVGSNWYVWFSTAQYLVRGGPYDMGISGTPTTGDIDGDGLADLISVVGSDWYVWFSTSQYLVRGGPYAFNISGTPLTGDVDGDGLADIISVTGTNWYVWFSTSQYLVRGGPYTMTLP